MRIAIGSRPRGVRAEGGAEGLPASRGARGADLGTDSEEPVDYPAFCAAAARAVVAGEADRAIVLGGSGPGRADRGEQGARRSAPRSATTCTSRGCPARAQRRERPRAWAARVVAPAYAKEIVRVWLATPFEGGRHVPRLEQIAAIERGELIGMREYAADWDALKATDPEVAAAIAGELERERTHAAA